MQKYFLFTVCLMLNIVAFAQNGVKFKTITILPKQTLYGIAREYNVPASEIKKCNSQYAPDFKFKIGDKIKIPVGATITTAKTTEVKTEKAPVKKAENTTSNTVDIKKEKIVTDVPAPQTKPVSTTAIHVVKKGETLTAIAKSYGMSLKEIRSLNDLSENVNVKIGQKIRVKSNEKVTLAKTEKVPTNQVVYKQTQEKQEVNKAKEETSGSATPPLSHVEEKSSSKEIVPAPLPTPAAETASPSTGKPITGELENTYNNAFNKNSKKTVRGIGSSSTEPALRNSSSVLYNYAEVGDIVKVVNLMSKKVAYLKVVGHVTVNDETNQNIIQISPETAKMLNANENKFLVEVTSY